MTIQIIRRSATFDQYGDPTGSSATTDAPPSCFVAPRSSTEIIDRGRSGVIEGLALFGPLDLDILPTDQVIVDGVLYDVEGQPGRWRSPFSGWQAGTEVALRQATG